MSTKVKRFHSGRKRASCVVPTTNKKSTKLRKKSNDGGTSVCESSAPALSEGPVCEPSASALSDGPDVDAQCNVDDNAVGFQRPLAESERAQMIAEMDHLRRERDEARRERDEARGERDAAKETWTRKRSERG